MATEHDQSLEEQLFEALRDHNCSTLGTLLGTLILSNVDIDAPDESGWTPLEAAFEWGCPDKMLLMLIESGADVGPVKDQIAWAAKSASPRALKKFIEAGADVDQPSRDGRPLQLAASSGVLESVLLLLAAGADVDAGTTTGNPLADAVEHGHAECALALLAAGAKPKLAKRSRPLVGVAAYKGMRDVVEALLDAGDDPNGRISLREEHGVIDELTTLFDRLFEDPPEGERVPRVRGSELPKLRYADATPLMVAAGEGHADIVRRLVTRGADITATDADGLTAFEIAHQRQQPECVIALLDGGADPHPTRPFERVLLGAAENGDVLQVRELARRNADLDVRDRRLATQGHTPLMVAAAKGHLQVVAELLELGANPSARDPEHRTALHLAAAAGHVDVVRALLAGGAECDSRTVAGKTPLMLAVTGDAVELAKELLAAGADPFARDCRGVDIADRLDREDSPMSELIRSTIPTTETDAGAAVPTTETDAETGTGQPQPKTATETVAEAGGKPAEVDRESLGSSTAEQPEPKAARKRVAKKKTAKKATRKRVAKKKATKKATRNKVAEKKTARKATRKRLAKKKATRKATRNNAVARKATKRATRKNTAKKKAAKTTGSRSVRGAAKKGAGRKKAGRSTTAKRRVARAKARRS